MLVGEAYGSEPESPPSLLGLNFGRLRVRWTGNALFGRTAAVLFEFHWLAWLTGLSRSRRGAEGGRCDFVLGSGAVALMLLLSLDVDVDDRRLPFPSDWFFNRQIFKPAQKRSKLSSPLAGVTRRRQSITPGGKPFEPSSCHRCSMSDSRTNPVRLSSMISNNVLILLTNRFGRLSSGLPELTGTITGGDGFCMWCDCCTFPITTPVLLVSGTAPVLFRFIVIGLIWGVVTTPPALIKHSLSYWREHERAGG